MFVMINLFSFSFGEWAKGIFLGLLTAWIVPIIPFIGAAVLTVVGNTITGVLLIEKRGQKFSGKEFNKSIKKLLFYMVVLLVSEGVMQLHEIGRNILPLVYTISMLISYRELRSIYENAQEYTDVNFVAYLKSAFSKLTNFDPDKKE